MSSSKFLQYLVFLVVFAKLQGIVGYWQLNVIGDVVRVRVACVLSNTNWEEVGSVRSTSTDGVCKMRPRPQGPASALGCSLVDRRVPTLGGGPLAASDFLDLPFCF